MTTMASFKKIFVISACVAVGITFWSALNSSKLKLDRQENTSSMMKNLIRSLFYESMTVNRSAPLSSHLRKSGILPRSMSNQTNNNTLAAGSALFVTMIDSSYIPAARVFNAALQKYYLHANFILICLDDPCVQLGRTHGLLVSTTFINSSVAKIKFEIDLDLTEAGFDFILLDCDVYLSQYHYPLAFMLPWNNHSWDIQFQSDQNDLKGSVNIGWFWSRPSIRTLEYYRKARERWLNQGGWDQAVMNGILREIEVNNQKNENNLSVLRAVRLDPNYYVNFMLTRWFSDLSSRNDDPKNIYNQAEDVRYEMILNASKSTVMWHYTCVEKSLKSFFAKYHGHWTDIDGYYTKKRLFLSPINIGYGLNDSHTILSQFVESIRLAALSDRTLIFPDIIYIHQTIRWPGVRAFSVKELDFANMTYVEPNYLFHRETKYKISRPIPVVLQASSPNLIYDVRTTLVEKEVVVLDFNRSHPMRSLKLIDVSNLSSEKHFQSIRLCKNLGSPVGCLQICV